MGYLVLGIAVLAIFLLLGQAFTKANPARLAERMKMATGVALLLIAGFLLLTGRWVLALPIGGFALTLLGLRKIPGFSPAGSSSPSGGGASSVRSRFLDMRLDHSSGKMDGLVLEGRFQGQMLSGLALGELKELWRDVMGDDDSRALLEAYLDRRQAGWRVDFEADAAGRQSGPARSGAMTEEEAYQVLGLSHGAGETEIRAAHRRLMKRLHPDHGGTSFLAAKLNEAKDVLLRRH
ncbi:DnaJ domain-containing protein [Stappia sp. F7233]|uniref:DnaJ domain-containing protein n=1 Tax=Stappia albiluteola TaxID=2758565 RepID=A0A839AGI1_9HYPH|nr:DnaJ domain-containing protein [Stappia albiluteola]MBA5777982.1 DnaJ domain-containing protein [Stappia albiluteola]